jgi:hypothetical protein
VVTAETGTPHFSAAAAASAVRAVAAIILIGIHSEKCAVEPPVSWLKISSGRASARVTFTSSMRMSSSSAMTCANEVVMP